MTDKILFIDFMNFLWRGNITFGEPATHEICAAAGNVFGCQHEKENQHCVCGASWDNNKQTCYGELYNITFNFFRNLRPIIELFSPDKVFVVLEGHPKYRYDLYSEYKANRIIKYASKKEEKDKIFEQKEIVLRVLKHFPITIARAEDFECDDTISTLVRNMSDEDITIVSNDTDFIQLLQAGFNNVKIYSANKKIFYEAPDHFYLAFKSLAGDKSDNIKGLVGKKKAETLVKNPDKFEAFLKLEENRANFNINKKLIEFANVPLEQLLLEEGQVNWEQIFFEFNQMQFNSITNPNSWKKYKSTFDCIKY